MQAVRCFACVIAFLLVFLPLGADGNQRPGDPQEVPADYIIAGNLNHELGQRWLKARSLKGQGEFAQSRIQYILLLEAYPDLIQARYEYVEVLQFLGRVTEVEVELEFLLESDPLNMEYKQALGRLLLEQGQDKQGIILLNEVWQEREDADLGHLLYRVYIRQGLKKKALPVLETLYQQSPANLRLHEELFMLYLELGDDLKAQNFSPPVTENSPTSLQRFVLAAQLHQRLGLEHIAADYWQAVLKQQPDFKLAHASLARYYTENSRANEALPHQIFLYNNTEDDGRIAGEIGDYYVTVQECSQAVFFLQRSLARDPNQVKRIRDLAYCSKQMGAKADAAQFFNRYLALQQDPTAEDRLTAALVFVEAGMAAEAASQYKELLVQTPGDIDLLVALARVEVSRGRLAQALLVWKQIAKRKPNDVASRTEILALAEKLGPENIDTVLAELHILDPGNHKVSLILALGAFKNGDMVQGWNLFKPLAAIELFGADLLALRGEIYLLLNQPEHSFADFAEALRKDVNLSEHVVLSYLQVAGVLGRLDTINQLNQDYHFDQSPDLQQLLIYADALAESGDLAGGIGAYAKILGSQNSDLWPAARHGLAQLYARYGFPFEAEQEDRLNWLESRDSTALLRLVHKALRRGETNEAAYWLDQYNLSGKGFDPLVYHAELQLLVAEGESERALELSRDFNQACRDAGAACHIGEMRIALEQAEILFQDEELEAAQGLVLAQEQAYPDAFLPKIYRLKWAEISGLTADTTRMEEQLLHKASGDAGDLDALQRLTREHGLFNFTTQINRKLYNEHPQSLKYGLALLTSLLEKSSFDEALNLIVQLQSIYPESSLLSLHGARVSLATGDFQKGLEFIGAPRSGFPLFELELLRARFLWGMARWDEALRVYEKNSTPSAEEAFLQESEALQLQFPPISEPSLWVRVVKPLSLPRTPLERSFVLTGDVAPDASALARLGTGFFAQKRWQDLFVTELSARKSLRRREFFHAVNQYEAMAETLNEPALLLDLADVYANLNRVGDEAVVYEKIQQINPDFPGLSQAMNRNQLQRRPRTGMRSSYVEEEGWEGYQDIRQWTQEAYGWYSPKPRTEGTLAVSRLFYSDVASGEKVNGNEMRVGFTSDVFDYFRIDMSGGMHTLDDDYPDRTVFAVSITGMGSDFLKSYVGVEQRVVKDTIASLNRGITAKEYTAQTTVDLFPRFQVGGKLFRIDYSDENEMNGYSVWGILILQTEPYYLYFRGGYEFIDHQDGAGGSGPVLGDGFAEDDHPYWTPVNYWRNQYLLGYKYTYPDTLFGYHIPGSFDLSYSAEYDSQGELFHHAATGVTMELTESWIFSLAGSLDVADEFEGFRLQSSLEYRW